MVGQGEEEARGPWEDVSHQVFKAPTYHEGHMFEPPSDILKFAEYSTGQTL